MLPALAPSWADRRMYLTPARSARPHVVAVAVVEQADLDVSGEEASCRASVGATTSTGSPPTGSRLDGDILHPRLARRCGRSCHAVHQKHARERQIEHLGEHQRHVEQRI